MERANLYPDEIQTETAVGPEERQRLATRPPPSLNPEKERTEKTISLGQLINKLNHLNFFDKHFGRLEARYEVLLDNNRGIFRNVPSYFLGSLFVYKAAKPPNVYIFPISH